tara:strand:+ start:104 stop:352 length:249 start_codon:yes stop_codon:yes gene_type:complete
MEEEKSNIYSTTQINKISDGIYEPRKPQGFPFDLNALCKFDVKFDFGFDSLKDSIEWLAKRQSNLELRMEENNLKISDLADN